MELSFTFFNVQSMKYIILYKVSTVFPVSRIVESLNLCCNGTEQNGRDF